MNSIHTPLRTVLPAEAVRQTFAHDLQEACNVLAQHGVLHVPGATPMVEHGYRDEPMLQRVEAHLSHAESKLAVRTELPIKLQRRVPLMRFAPIRRFLLRAYEYLFREQRVIGYALLAAWRDFLRTYRERQQHVEAQLLHIDMQQQSIQQEVGQLRQESQQQVDSLKAELLALKTSLLDKVSRAEQLQASYEVVQGQLQLHTQQLQNAFDQFSQALTSWQHGAGQHLNELQQAFDRLQQAHLQMIEQVNTDLQSMTLQMHERIHAQDDRIRTVEAKQRLQGVASQGDVPVATSNVVLSATTPATTALDEFYLQFENTFRGSCASIRQHLVESYQPLIQQAGFAAGARALDIGCGRGEWLSLLRDWGLSAEGVDLNAVMAAFCQEQGLQVSVGDGIAYLDQMPSGSLSLLSAFHVIEHLPFALLGQLVEQAFRVLRPGGLLILETPNPENLIVGSCNFWNDPTHIRPLPPLPVRFLLENQGFAQVDVCYLHPRGEVDPAAQGGYRELLERLYIGQDYALIARR